MTRLKTAHILIAAITASFVLSACGIKGSLNTPPPVWGDAKDGMKKPVNAKKTDPAETPSATDGEPVPEEIDEDYILDY